MGNYLVIPAYNEEETIAGVVALAIESQLFDAVVVVDNGSTDATAERAGAEGARVITCLEPGKWAAVNAGYLALPDEEDDLLVLCDADLLRLSKKHFVDVLSPVQGGRTNVAIGVVPTATQKVVKEMSGFRAMYKSVFDGFAQWWDPLDVENGYCLEREMNRYLQEQGYSVEYIFLKNLGHRTKLKKLGFVKGTIAFFKMWYQIGVPWFR